MLLFLAYNSAVQSHAKIGYMMKLTAVLYKTEHWTPQVHYYRHFERAKISSPATKSFEFENAK